FQPSGNNSDQPSVTTGPSSVPGQASVWVNYTTTSGTLVARGAAITGLGAIGALGASESTGNHGDFGDLAIGPSGQMFTVYQSASSGAGPDSIRGNLDADGLGAGSFGSTVTTTATQVGGFAPIPAQPQRDIDAEAGLAWDCSGGPHNGRLYLMY